MPAKTDLPRLTLREPKRPPPSPAPPPSRRTRPPAAAPLLLTRRRIGAVDAIERLACLQGQWAPSPYVALWSRLAGFKRDDLTRPPGQAPGTKAPILRR